MVRLKWSLPKILSSCIENWKSVEIGYILLNFKDFCGVLCGDGIILTWIWIVKKLGSNHMECYNTVISYLDKTKQL